MVTVSALTIAPVKGLAPVPRSSVRLGPSGVAEDRRVLLLDTTGAVVTMRRHPELVRVVPDVDLTAGELSVRLPDGGTASSPLADAGEPVEATLFGKHRTGRVLSGAVADALSAVAGEPLRVVVGPAGVGWDEGPVSLVSRASVAAVDTPDDDADRYRMLLTVDGCDAFAEDGWVGGSLAIGGAVVRVSHPLVRCVVIEHDPTSGDHDWRGLKSLAVHRGRDSLTLGIIATVEQPGTVRVGDDVLAAWPDTSVESSFDAHTAGAASGSARRSALHTEVGVGGTLR